MPDSHSKLFADTFAPLAFFNEIVLRSNEEIRRQADVDGETVLYVRTGTIRYADSTGRSEVISAGAFARFPARHGGWCTHTNESNSHDAQAVEIGVHSAGAALEEGGEQRRFTAAQRRGTLCIVASSDGRQGSLQLAANVTVFSAILLPGQHIVHESIGRRVWLFVLEGELTVGAITAAVREGVGFAYEQTLPIRANANAEFVLVEVGGEPVL